MKVLFFCPEYLGIYKIIENGIIDYKNYNVTTLLFDDYVYKNKFEKILNFLSKLFLNKNLKKKWASKSYLNQVDLNIKYDYVFIICPDYFLNPELKKVTMLAKTSIVYYWDSFKQIKQFKRTLPFFDVKYSFEPNDVAKYQMNLLTNFYYDTNKNNTINYDVFYIAKFDERISTIEKITNLLLKHNLNPKILIKVDAKTNTNKYSKNISFITEYISFEENQKILKESKIILDIHKKIQNGLSFRVFEALALHKKLITTNKDIINYDFYNPNNIFVWDEYTNKIPIDFLEKEYEQLPNEIFKKYSLESWIKTVFIINK